jgi:hypothetical protein
LPPLRPALALVALGLSACAPILDYSAHSPIEEEADYVRTLTNYRQLALAQVSQLKYSGGLLGPAISPLRKSHLVALADWMACIQGEGEGQHKIFAIFYRDRQVTDFRQAVVIDRCEQDTYEPLAL